MILSAVFTLLLRTLTLRNINFMCERNWKLMRLVELLIHFATEAVK